MESITKNRQSAATLRGMLERAYGRGSVPPGDDFYSELGHGWFNVAYEAHLADGRRVVLKIAPPPGVEVLGYERDAMRIEMETLRLLNAQTTVPVPPIDHLETARDLVDADWFAMPFMPGDNIGITEESLSPEQKSAYWREVGRLNREINTVVGPAFGRVDDPRFATWREAFLDLFEQILTDGERRNVVDDQDHDELRRLFAAHAHTLDEVTIPQLVEWDLWLSNVMADEGRVTAIIDHERAVFGDPLFEAGFTGIDMPEFTDAEAFMAGYGHAPLTEAEATRRLLYSVYLMLVMTIETVYRGHETPAQYDFARKELATLVDRLRAR